MLLAAHLLVLGFDAEFAFGRSVRSFERFSRGFEVSFPGGCFACSSVGVFLCASGSLIGACLLSRVPASLLESSLSPVLGFDGALSALFTIDVAVSLELS